MLYNVEDIKKSFDTKDTRFSGYKKIILDVYSENQQAEDMFDDMYQCIVK